MSEVYLDDFEFEASEPVDPPDTEVDPIPAGSVLIEDFDFWAREPDVDGGEE